MQAVYDMFDERIQEIDLYFEAMTELDEGNLEHIADAKYFNTEFIKMLKANSLLMIYNLVESTVIGGILEIYGKLKQEGLTYASVRKEIKDIWFSYKFQQVYDRNAHYNAYRDKALEIVNSILIGEVIELDRKATAISGNLDAQQIRLQRARDKLYARGRKPRRNCFRDSKREKKCFSARNTFFCRMWT